MTQCWANMTWGLSKKSGMRGQEQEQEGCEGEITKENRI